MNNLFSIFAIVFILYIIFSSKESFENNEDLENYYVDKTGKSEITYLPLELNNIYELKYTNTTKDTMKFLLTKGSYKHSESKNELRIVNGKSEKYQLIHLKSDIPFSGILF